MPRVCARDAERGAVACDRARLAVVARIDDRGRALGLRQFVPHAGDGRREGGPADRFDGVLVDVGNRRRMHVRDRHERQRDERRDSGRQEDRDRRARASVLAGLATSSRRRRRRRRARRGADPSCSRASLPRPARSRAERGTRSRADGTAEPRLGAAATRDHRATAARGEGRSREAEAAEAPPGSLPPPPLRSCRRARVGASRGEPARGGSAATARRRVRFQPTARDCGPDPSGAQGGNRT